MSDLTKELHEAAADLLSFLHVHESTLPLGLNALAEGESKFIKDSKFNLKSVLQSKILQPKESALLALAIAVNEKNDILINAMTNLATAEGASKAEIAEMFGVASLLAANNVYYRFKHFMNSADYEQQPFKIKMSLMMSPVTGKEFFELASLAVSAVNGCEACVTSHEHSLRELGSSPERIHEAARLAALVRGVSILVR